MSIRLKPDVKRKLIQLLAIEEDANRKLHVGHDTFRTVAMEILNGQRKVTVAKSSQQSRGQIDINGSQININGKQIHIKGSHVINISNGKISINNVQL